MKGKKAQSIKTTFVEEVETVIEMKSLSKDSSDSDCSIESGYSGSKDSKTEEKQVIDSDDVEQPTPAVEKKNKLLSSVQDGYMESTPINTPHSGEPKFADISMVQRHNGSFIDHTSEKEKDGGDDALSITTHVKRKKNKKSKKASSADTPKQETSLNATPMKSSDTLILDASLKDADLGASAKHKKNKKHKKKKDKKDNEESADRTVYTDTMFTSSHDTLKKKDEIEKQSDSLSSTVTNLNETKSKKQKKAKQNTDENIEKQNTKLTHIKNSPKEKKSKKRRYSEVDSSLNGDQFLDSSRTKHKKSKKSRKH